MNGRRVPDEDAREGLSLLEAGDYRKAVNYPPDGAEVWDCCTPNGHAGNLRAHEVTEHEDGTITVSPSILVSDGSNELWHGWLERGVWRSV